jgi:hypothetical protein
MGKEEDAPYPLTRKGTSAGLPETEMSFRLDGIVIISPGAQERLALVRKGCEFRILC